MTADPKKYGIHFVIDGRLVAHMDLDGTLNVRHDHFKDEEGFQLDRFIHALDRWTHSREIAHISKRGLNTQTLEVLNQLQEQKPGKVWLPPLKSAQEQDR